MRRDYQRARRPRLQSERAGGSRQYRRGFRRGRSSRCQCHPCHAASLTLCSAGRRDHIALQRTRSSSAFFHLRPMRFFCGGRVCRMAVPLLRHIHAALALSLRPTSRVTAPVLCSCHIIRHEQRPPRILAFALRDYTRRHHHRPARAHHARPRRTRRHILPQP